MNDNELIELLKAHTDASAPDKEALWKNIESRLEPKTRAAAPIKRGFEMKRFAAVGSVAAGIVLILGLFSTINIRNSMTDTLAPDNSISASKPSADENAQDLDNAGNADVADAVCDTITPAEPILSYADIPFSSYSETILQCSGEPYGDSFFVEENVLAQTDVLLSAEVTRVFLSEDGSSICYELGNVEYYDEKDAEVYGEAPVITSRSRSAMRRGRRYLLALACEDGALHTVFDGVPQVEFTEDGGLVYFNGWSLLDDQGAQAILYEQKNAEDFYYDRMKFSRSGSVSRLVGTWLEQTRADS